MKIGNPLELFRSGTPPGGAASTEADKAKAIATPAQPLKGETSATVTLSGGLSTLGVDTTSDGAFDAKRVEEVKALIAEGSFKVDAEVVANKVISSNLEALLRGKR
ncbi:MAG: flagellar biosynthesis anti-sigma factor FlgM [Betaproteobacteria bacterium]|nr:flagellar biosynthesis anti-sigma factor FlgM [Betaproteobacteria bacterium]